MTVQDRLAAALAEITKRRAAAEECAGSDIGWWTEPGLTEHLEELLAGEVLHPRQEAEADAAHIAANDPAHVLAVLNAAEATLRRHVEGTDRCIPPCVRCDACRGLADWPCPDVVALLDLYAPAVDRG